MICKYSTIPLDSISLADLVLAAQENDSAAFGELVDRFGQTVYGIAIRRLRNHDEAQELRQEVFIKVMEKIHQLRVPEAFPGWLRSITIRMAVNRATRSASPIPVDSETLEAVVTDSETPIDRVMSIERSEQLHGGLDRLIKLDRETLVAFYLEGQTLLEMSREFASPVGTIKRRLHVARKRLAKELKALAF